MTSARCVSAAIIVGLAALGSVAAKQQMPRSDIGSDQGCYSESFDEAHGPVKNVFLRDHDRAVVIELWGVPHLRLFTIPESCKAHGAVVECFMICDGGNLSITIDKNRHAHLITQRARMAPMVDTAVPLSSGYDDVVNSGTYDLAPAPSQTCTTAFDFTIQNGAALHAGDFNPRVESVERMLSELGYFAERPDWYFNAQTERALREFQRAMNLSETGEADQFTIRRLREQSAAGDGC
jgi:hypothetical protein